MMLNLGFEREPIRQRPHCINLKTHNYFSELLLTKLVKKRFQHLQFSSMFWLYDPVLTICIRFEQFYGFWVVISNRFIFCVLNN